MGYRIKDVAERTGFSTATLRYYEEIGLLPAAARTGSGYRLYDDRTIERLGFIARAKQLGCTLEEIRALNEAWDGGRCGPVQDRLQATVAQKLAEATARIAELRALTVDLRRSAAALERHRPDGPCDDRCGCVSDPAPSSPGPLPVTFGAKPLPPPEPIACTLATDQIDSRIADWNELLAHATDREAIDSGVRLSLDPTTSVAELVRLTTAEHECCGYFHFAITVDGRGLALEATAPDDALPLVHALFGEPT